MNQKGIVILFFILAFTGLAVAGYSQFKEDAKTPAATPSPTPAEVIFTFGSPNPQGAPQPQAGNPQPQATVANIGGKQVKQYSQFPGVYSQADLKDKGVIIKTAKGDIGIVILPDAPKAASNFLFLASQGFYDNLTFHRVEPGFVIQGGDPLGNGTGGPGYKFEDEPVQRKYSKGIVAMANSGPNTNGSQFFIMLDDNLTLPPKYTIFGMVAQGMETVEKIAVGDVMQKVSVVKVDSQTP